MFRLKSHRSDSFNLVLIMGTRRSGTTLVNNIICRAKDTNPHVAEIQPLTHLLDAFGWCDENYDRITKDMFPSRAVYRSFVADTCRALVRQAWIASGRKKNLILKNPELSLHVADVLAIWPSAKVIACIRDPRDQISSELDVVEQRIAMGEAISRPSIEALADIYAKYVSSLLAVYDNNQHRIMLLKYEELVGNSTKAVASVASFCGLEFNDFTPNRRWPDESGILNRLLQRPSFSPLYGQAINASRVGRHKERLPSSSSARINEQLGSIMKRLGYAGVAASVTSTAPAAPAESISFALIAEAGPLEAQATLLCESIRTFSGPYANAKIIVASPRLEKRPSPRVVAHLRDLGVDYREYAVNSAAAEYGTTFRIHTAALVEQDTGEDALVFLDSDLVFCNVPDIDLGGADMAARPVDLKGMCTTGSSDPYDGYWRELCRVCKVDYDSIPMVRTTVERLLVKASYNGGFIIAKRRARIFGRTEEFFIRSVKADLRPQRGRSLRIEAGHGAVEGLGAEFWGSAQACLSLAVWGSGLSVRILPGTHNYPLHIAEYVAGRRVMEPLVAIHYHRLFQGDQSKNPILTGQLNVSSAFTKWLQARLPLPD